MPVGSMRPGPLLGPPCIAGVTGFADPDASAMDVDVDVEGMRILARWAWLLRSTRGVLAGRTPPVLAPAASPAVPSAFAVAAPCCSWSRW